MSLSHFDRAAALDTLQTTFGHSSFQPGQEDVLDAIFAGDDVLAVMPTGSGKSLCYQLPGVMRTGLTLVVSPLIALMRDQVLALQARGIASAALHSLNTAEDNSAILRQIQDHKLNLLYIAPERLALPHMQHLLAQAGVRLVAVDEAHCLSQWGHDFRPDYRDIPAALQALGTPQTIALTASADGPTRADLVTHLFARPPRVLVRSFQRPNLRLSFQPKGRSHSQVARFVARHRGQCGLVYAATRRRTEVLAALLRQRGHDAHAYHAGLEPGPRATAQDAFLTRPAPVIVGTVAFGLGIDRPDVRFVCHADMPASVEAYYQEIGRAGRDGRPANTLTLYGEEDLLLRRAQIADHDRNLDQQALEAARLTTFWALCHAPTCRQVGMLAAMGEITLGEITMGEAAAPCGQCDICRDWAGRWWRRLRSRLSSMPPAIPEPAAPEPILTSPTDPVLPLPALSVAHSQRLATLKAARLTLARQRRLAPSVICSDLHLRALARGALPHHLQAADLAHVQALLALCPDAEQSAQGQTGRRRVDG